jgi:hypothetical protein
VKAAYGVVGACNEAGKLGLPVVYCSPCGVSFLVFAVAERPCGQPSVPLSILRIALASHFLAMLCFLLSIHNCIPACSVFDHRLLTVVCLRRSTRAPSPVVGASAVNQGLWMRSFLPKDARVAESKLKGASSVARSEVPRSVTPGKQARPTRRQRRESVAQRLLPGEHGLLARTRVASSKPSDVLE